MAERSTKPSFSSKTIAYKGLLVAPQLPLYYRDLSDPNFTSAIAVFHQRYSTNTFPNWARAHPYRYLAHNGVLLWTSITGGQKKAELPSDKINIEWVLGNKMLIGSVNGNRHHFEMGISDLAQGEMMFPGVLQRILTNPVNGLDNYREMMRLLVEEKSALKVYVNVAEA